MTKDPLKKELDFFPYQHPYQNLNPIPENSLPPFSPENLFTQKPVSEPKDLINHPPHYKQHPSGIECITITEHFNFNVGNAIKYLWRSDHKNGIEDLKKAQWYINREIERRAKES